jgi:antitoxin VapB
MPTDDSPFRRVKLFQNGRNQAVRIPRESELPEEDALMRKDGPRLIIEPVGPRSLVVYSGRFRQSTTISHADPPTNPIHL